MTTSLTGYFSISAYFRHLRICDKFMYQNLVRWLILSAKYYDVKKDLEFTIHNLCM